MKASTKNRAKGRTEEVAGKVKSKAGKLTGNQRLRDRGDAEAVDGKVRRKAGEIAKVFGA